MTTRTTTARTRRDLFGGALLSAGLAATATAQTSFTTSTIASFGSASTAPALRIADLNADGAPDIVALAGFTRVYRSDGAADPSFTSDSYSFSGVNTIVADLNGDGNPDLLFSDSYTCTSSNPDNCYFLPMTWSENLGASDFAFGAVRASIRIEGGGGARSYDALAWGDIDGDGANDLVATSSIDDSITWIRQPTQENGPTTVLDDTTSFSGDGELSSRLEIVDLDDDGDNDLLTAANGGIFWFENDGNTSPFFVKRTVGALGGAIRIDPIDINGDGHLDVAFGTSTGELGYFLSDGQFNPAFSKIIVDTATEFTDFDAHDMDLDGDVDLVTSVPGVEVRWYESDGQPTPGFMSHQIVPLKAQDFGSPPDFIFTPGELTDARLVIADYDNDGDPDIVHALQRDGVTDIVVHENDFDPTAPIVIQSPKHELALSGTEANLDVLVLGSNPKFYQWRFNGVPLTDGPNVSGTDTDTLTIAAAELANVGFYDCVVTNQFGAETTLEGSLAVALPPGSCQADLTGDGNTDVFDFSVLAADFGCQNAP